MIAWLVCAAALHLTPKPSPAAHAVVRYVDGQGVSHRLEIWRDGRGRVRRDTDSRLSVFAEQVAGEVRLEVIDRVRGLRIAANRTLLSRLGTFTDFTSFESGLIVAPGLPWLRTPSAKTIACSWYALSPSVKLCFSEVWKMAVQIDQAGRTTWMLEQVDGKVSETDFVVPPLELFEIDANDELGAD